MIQSTIPNVIGHVNNIPTMQFSLEFPEILSQNLICYHWLSVSEISKIKHCGILIYIPYYCKYWWHWIFTGDIASTSRDKTIRLWDIGTRRCLVNAKLPSNTGGGGYNRNKSHDRERLWLSSVWLPTGHIISSSHRSDCCFYLPFQHSQQTDGKIFFYVDYGSFEAWGQTAPTLMWTWLS